MIWSLHVKIEWEDISDSDNEGGERKNDEKLEENKPDNQNKKDESFIFKKQIN